MAAPDTAPSNVRAPGRRLPLWRIVLGATASRLELDLLSTSIVGQLVPPTAGDVVIEWRSVNTRHAYINAAGRFAVDQVTTGDIRIRLATAASAVLTTPWLLV